MNFDPLININIIFFMQLVVSSQSAFYSQVSILYKSIAGRYWPIRVADGTITARYRFIKNASWDKSIAGRYRPVRVSDGPITVRCRIMKNASWVLNSVNP